jgi:hypothetical protein
VENGPGTTVVVVVVVVAVVGHAHDLRAQVEDPMGEDLVVGHAHDLQDLRVQVEDPMGDDLVMVAKKRLAPGPLD